MGLLDFLSDKLTGTPAMPGMAQPTALEGQLLQQKADRAGLSDADLYKENMQGVQEHLPSGEMDKPSSFSDKLGANDPSMSHAIQERANRLYGSDLNQLQRQTKAGMPAQRAQIADQAFQPLMGQQNLAEQANAQQVQADMNRRALRNSVISSLFQAGGSAAGMAAGRSQAGGAMTTSEQNRWDLGMDSASSTRLPASNYGRVG